MKNLFILTALVLSLKSFAATTGDITISGTVDAELSLTLSTNSYTTLDIEGGGDHTVATANEVCNDLDGYKIYGYSTNGSELQNTDNTNVSTSYTVKYDGSSAVSLGAGSANKVQLKDSGALTSSADEDSDIVVDVSAFATAPAGTYTDTITLEIVAN
ncbi:MAG: hypothetical protein CME62_16775 [Halobacteriovoraceae bacterium]|nr:hypothetical protein [Halobacteriovoraceae bacterium]